MREIILDACSLINLHEGGVLGIVLQLRGHSFFVGGMCLEESGEPVREAVKPLVGAGTIRILDDSQMPADKFLSLSDEYGLGDGETECLLFSQLGNQVMCTDDKAARAAAAKALGDERVTGTIGLLRLCVSERLVRHDEAYQAYEKMVRAGAFLPKLASDFFMS